MGHSTTQRFESWHAVLKCFNNGSCLTDLVKNIKFLVERQGLLEGRSQSDVAFRLSPLGNENTGFGSEVMDIAKRKWIFQVLL